MSEENRSPAPAPEEHTRPIPLQDLTQPAAPEPPVKDQDTVVSPRLKQLTQHTPSQPLRPPVAPAAQPSSRLGNLLGNTSSRVVMLGGLIAVLILLAMILIVVFVAKNRPQLVAILGATKIPTPTMTLPPSRTPMPTATLPPATPTLKPSPVPPTATPRPAPVTLAKDVRAQVTPPEGLKLKVRDAASTTGKVLGELDKDALVAIVDGPTDANGIKWWKVDAGNNLVGWAAEGVGGVKYLQPVSWAR